MAPTDTAEAATSRLWRDRAEIRERERDEARARTRVAEEKVAILTTENERLADENTRLRAELWPHDSETAEQVEAQMEAIRCALAPLIVRANLRQDAKKRGAPLGEPSPVTAA
jgi:hypothetical protein